MEYFLELYLKEEVVIDFDVDKWILLVMDYKIKDDFFKYYDLFDEVYSKGYIIDEV